MRYNNYHKLVSELPDPTSFKKLSSTLPQDPIEWTEKTRILNGQPFSFKGRKYLEELYRNEDAVMLIRKGRQTEITEMLCNLMFYNAWRYPHSTHLYITNTQQKAYRFSKRRIRDTVLRYSPIIEKIAPLKNFQTTEITLVNGSICYFLSGHDDFKESRSISGDFTYCDEIQSMVLREKANLTEATSHSQFNRLIAVGTGSLNGTDWHKWFKMGTDSRWDKKKKKWLHKNPKARIKSYWIPQTIVPWISAKQIALKKEEMPHADFEREVLGNWVKGDEVPITDEMVERLFQSNLSFTEPKDIDRNKGPVIVSWDWGGGEKSWTVGAAYQAVKIGNTHILVLLKIELILFPDIMAQAQRAIQFTDSYDPDIINIDSGGGGHQVQAMEKFFGPVKVWKTHYMGRTSNPYKLDEFYTKGLIKVDRTHSLQSTFDIIRNPYISNKLTIPRVHLPGLVRKEMEWIYEHYTSLYAVETKSRAGDMGLSYDKLTDKRSDALMNLNYANIGLYVWLNRVKQISDKVFTGKMGGSI